MNKKIRSKIKRFLESEEGRISSKAPLVLGISGGSALLAQVILPPFAHAGSLQCLEHDDCEPGQICSFWCDGTLSQGTCIGEWNSVCINIP